MEVSPAGLGPDDRGDRRAPAVRLRLPRPQGPCPRRCVRRRSGRRSTSASRVLFGLGVLVFGGTDARVGVLRRLRHREGALGRQPLRLPDHHDQLPGAARGPAEGTAVRHRVRAHRPHRVHLPRRRADQLVRLGLLPLRADPAAHRRQHAQARGRGVPHRRTTSSSGWPARCSTPPTTTTATSCSPCTRAAGDDPDAAGDGRHRRHRHPLRPRLDPGDLRADPEHLHRLHRHRLLAAGAAAAVLPHRRACWTG